MAFFGIIVGKEQQTATDDAGILHDDTSQMAVQAVGIVNVALYLMHAVDIGDIDLRQSALYLPVHPQCHYLIALLGFVAHILPHGEIHHTGNDTRHCQYYHHDV